MQRNYLLTLKFTQRFYQLQVVLFYHIIYAKLLHGETTNFTLNQITYDCVDRKIIFPITFQKRVYEIMFSWMVDNHWLCSQVQYHQNSQIAN